MRFLALILAPNMLESQSRALKTRMRAQFPKKLEPKMARCVGAQVQVQLAEKAKTCHHYHVTHRIAQTQIKKKFLIENGRPAEAVDDLNTFLALSPGELWLK